MRKVTSGLFISLDGVVEAPDQWQFDVFDTDMGTAMMKYIGNVDTVLLGRVTYQEWAAYWPTANDDPYGSHINNVPKYVASKTLDRVDWQNSTLIQGSVADTIKMLKQQPGKDISVAGSPTLVKYLLQNDLLDEFTLMVHPVVVGKGKRFYDEGSLTKRYQLVDSMITASGVAFLTYHPR